MNLQSFNYLYDPPELFPIHVRTGCLVNLHHVSELLTADFVDNDLFNGMSHTLLVETFGPITTWADRNPVKNMEKQVFVLAADDMVCL